ncbi:hypothetical protein ACLOJK_028940 [Asimina triloba]
MCGGEPAQARSCVIDLVKIEDSRNSLPIPLNCPIQLGSVVIDWIESKNSTDHFFALSDRILRIVSLLNCGVDLCRLRVFLSKVEFEDRDTLYFIRSVRKKSIRKLESYAIQFGGGVLESLERNSAVEKNAEKSFPELFLCRRKKATKASSSVQKATRFNMPIGVDKGGRDVAKASKKCKP